MPRSISLQDLSTALSLSAMAVVGALLSPSYQQRAMGAFGALHVALRGSKSKQIHLPSIAPELDTDMRRLEKDFLAGVYYEMVVTLQEYRRGGWRPQIRIRGREHLDDALAAGRGAVLWAFPCTFGGLVGKKGLHDAGYPVAMLSSAVHPYSGTVFGRRFLNPIRTRIEDRYIVERVTLDEGPAAVAMRRVAQLLGENKLVEIAAIGAADSPARLPFLGGTLNLALGAPMAAMMNGAALIPYFPMPDGRNAFEICIEPPFDTNAGTNRRDDASRLARQYAALMKDYVLRAPHVWRGWFNRTNWLPGKPPE